MFLISFLLEHAWMHGKSQKNFSRSLKISQSYTSPGQNIKVNVRNSKNISCGEADNLNVAGIVKYIPKFILFIDFDNSSSGVNFLVKYKKLFIIYMTLLF